jgi:translation initiation factor IF-2
VRERASLLIVCLIGQRILISSAGVIVAFSVGTPRVVEQAAAQAGVPISSSGIIYQLMDDIKQRVIALLPVTVEKRVTGEATVLQLFDIHLKQKQTMRVAGCRITNGLVEKDKSARVVRNGEVIFEGVSGQQSDIILFLTKALSRNV